MTLALVTGAELAEGLLEIAVAHRVRQVADVKFVAHLLGLLKRPIERKRWSPENASNQKRK
jgi:hypothetical protein